MTWRSYSVYGLRVESTLPLPPLEPTSDGGQADVTITQGPVDPPVSVAADEDGFVVRDSTVLLDLPGTATFAARNGREIVVAPAPGSDAAAIRPFLLGSLMGAILHQRGLLPLHASAVRLGESAIAFCAASGGGKSTLAALLHNHGYPMICDDVGALEAAPDGAFLHPGVPRFRLTTEALAALEGEPSHEDGPARSAFKREIPVDPSHPRSTRTKLKTLYVLDYAHDDVRIEPLDDWQAFLELRRHVYRPALIRSLVKEPDFLRWAGIIQSQVAVFRLRRPRDLTRLGEVLDPLTAHLANLIKPRPESRAATP